MIFLLVFISVVFSLSGEEPQQTIDEKIHPLICLNESSSVDSVQKSTVESVPVYTPSSWPIEVNLSLALDDFRGPSEGTWEGNFGTFGAINFKAPLPYCLSVQLGGSWGIYDWYGRGSIQSKAGGSLQKQGFLTLAASRQTNHSSGWNGGIAYEWMINTQFGAFGVNARFDQIRGQIGYLIENNNEIGLWGTYGIHTAETEAFQISLQFRAISQINLFWVRYYANHGYMMLWVGTPYQRGLAYRKGPPGTFVFGTQFSTPLTKTLSLEARAAYMGARQLRKTIPSGNYASDLTIAISYSFGKRRLDQTPYMVIGNNSNFMTETNHNF